MSAATTTTPEEIPDSPSATFFNPRRSRCCFNFPCFGPGSGHASKPSLTLGGPPTGSFWDRVRAGESDGEWWARPITAFKKVREWSEIVAGPKWKTFIRRFNRNNRQNGHVGAGKFQYDPLSYALNFDDGQGQNGHFEEEDHYVDFSSRFVARTSVDYGKGAPASQ